MVSDLSHENAHSCILLWFHHLGVIQALEDDGGNFHGHSVWLGWWHWTCLIDCTMLNCSPQNALAYENPLITTPGPSGPHLIFRD
jgi:hypothetical protein